MVPKTLSPRVLLSFGFVLLTVAGAVWYFDAATLRLQNRAAEVYVPVSGTVVSTQLRHHRRNRGSGDTWSPHIVYRYAVAGRSYENDVYAHQHIAFPEAAPVQQLLDAHPAGATIRVYHDPEAPAVSVLTTQRPTTDGMWFPWLPGLGGALALVVAFRSSRPTQPGGPRRWTGP